MRPTDYTPELADSICARLADGESLRAVCRSDGMPDKSTVFRWLRIHAEFRDQYTRAKEESADALAEDILDIADTPQLGVKTKTTDKGTETTEGDMIEHRRLQVDARKWLASKLKPRKYADKVDLNHEGSIGMTITWPLPKTSLDQP